MNRNISKASYNIYLKAIETNIINNKYFELLSSSFLSTPSYLQRPNAFRSRAQLSREREKISHVRRGSSSSQGFRRRRHNARRMFIRSPRISRSSANQSFRLAKNSQDLLQTTQFLHKNSSGRIRAIRIDYWIQAR